MYLGFNTDVEKFGVKYYSNVFQGEDVTALKDIKNNHHGDWLKRRFIFVDYNKVNAGLAPPHKSEGVICAVDYIEDWENLNKEDYQARKEEIGQILLQRLEKQYPGIRNSIEYYEVSTPKTIKRYTSNPSGSVYGYAQTKDQIATKRFRNNFLIPNLYFASAWAFPGGGFEGSIQGGFLAALQMNQDKIWSECDDEKYLDLRIVSLLERKKIDDKTLELSFEKPLGLQHQTEAYANLNLLKPKVTELDVPYRWLPVASSAEEDSLRFRIELDGSSFSRSCELIEVGEEAIVFGP
ncbi:MAG: hypothetical protein AAFP76_13285 [Bacteroidota bacterium]